MRVLVGVLTRTGIPPAKLGPVWTLHCARGWAECHCVRRKVALASYAHLRVAPVERRDRPADSTCDPRRDHEPYRDRRGAGDPAPSPSVRLLAAYLAGSFLASLTVGAP